MSTRWCRFQENGRTSCGRIDGETVVRLDGAPWAAPAETADRYPLASVKLLPPVVPPTFYCVGLNYREHMIASAKRRGIEPKFPQRPDVNYRSSSAPCAHGDAIVKPADAGELFRTRESSWS